MKWLLLIILGFIVAVVIILETVGVLKIEDLFSKNNFPILERDFSYEDSITLELVNDQTIANMAQELIASLPRKESEKTIIVSQAKKNNTTLKRFKGHLVNNLPNNWSIVNRGNPDYIVTGYLFQPENNAKRASALFLFLIEWNTGKIVGATTNYTHSEITTICKGLIENLGNFSINDAQIEVINKVQDAQDLVSALILEKITTEAKPTEMTLLANDIYEELEEKLSDKQPPKKTVEADATLIITEDSNTFILELSKLQKDYEILAIKTNYTDHKITTACQNLIKNLEKDPETLQTIASLNVAVIHTQPKAQFSAKTALTLEEMVKAKLRLRLLGRNYTDAKKNHTQLRKAMQGEDLSETAKQNFRDIAVLSIEEDPDGFILELIRLSDHKVLVTSMSAPEPDRVSVNAYPDAKVFIIQPGTDKEDFIDDVPLMMDVPINATVILKYEGEKKVFPYKRGRERIYHNFAP